MADLFIDADPRFQKKGLPDGVRLGNLQNLLQDSLLSTGHVDKAALLNATDSSVLATSIGFKLDAKRASTLLQAVKLPALTRRQGVIFDGITYECVRAEDGVVYCKNGNTGIIAVRTNHSLLVAFYNHHMYPSVAAEATENLANYLREKGK